MASIHSPEPVSPASWYYQLKSSIHYSEIILQRVLKYRLEEMMPAYNVIYYDKSIKSTVTPFDSCRPDFLIWKNDYTVWFIVEVELETHHIAPVRKQIETFYNGDYGDASSITEYVAEKYEGLDVARFESLVASQRPQVMLMADSIKPEWVTEFSRYNCLFSSLQVYCDENEGFLYRISGEFPQEYTSFSYCTLHKRLRAIIVSNIDYLINHGYNYDTTLQVYYKGVAHKWDFSVSDGNEILYYAGESIPLDLTQTRWKLIKNDKNQLHLLKS